jgi:putative copper export protein/methionine-rich copper-binding protein CopC
MNMREFRVMWYGMMVPLLVMVPYSPAAASAYGLIHIQLEWSAPAAGTVVAEPVRGLQLRFSGFIERNYTSVALTAPTGGAVALGPVVFLAGSDREFTVATPPLTQPGAYTVRWRTAGADGHVLEGTYTFTLATDGMDPAAARDTVADAHDHPPAGHQGQHDSAGWRDVTARALHFAALILLIGALALRLVLMPRLGMPEAGNVQLRRIAWTGMAVAAFGLGVAIMLRLWLQSTALHGADRAWSTPLLSMMLTDTSWGRIWVLQAFAFTVLGAAIMWARPAADARALVLAVPAVGALAAMPALSGHAAGLDRAYLPVMNDTLHVAATGVWIGMLALLATAVLPLLIRRYSVDEAARAVHAFSPIALAAAATAVLTGLINALFHVGAPAQLLDTDYGRMLLIKVAIVLLVLLAGAVNWRVLRPRLASLGGLSRLRAAAAVELGLAALVLIATAVLTGLPRP